MNFKVPKFAEIVAQIKQFRRKHNFGIVLNKSIKRLIINDRVTSTVLNKEQTCMQVNRAHSDDSNMPKFHFLKTLITLPREV